PDLQLWRTWTLPDGSDLHLYRRHQVATRVEALESPPDRVRCDRFTLPALVSPGTAVPFGYTCAGSGDAMRSGLLLMSWEPDSIDVSTPAWWHDRAIASGQIVPESASTPGLRVREELALRVPANVPAGQYRLRATYLDLDTGRQYPIALPETAIAVSAAAPALDAPQLDFVTQLRQLGAPLAHGDLDAVFAVVGRLNQYDAEQDYLKQAERSLEFRLAKAPDAIDERYALGLARVLQRKVRPALDTFAYLTEVDAENPYAWMYLGFINLYRWHPREAEVALTQAHALAPDLPELNTLRGVAALMRLDVRRARQLL
ncbi:MAG: phospholipid carrier-dependent glycosyltransferase, partial [Cyanobacteria bacterium J06639_1]